MCPRFLEQLIQPLVKLQNRSGLLIGLSLPLAPGIMPEKDASSESDPCLWLLLAGCFEGIPLGL